MTRLTPKPVLFILSLAVFFSGGHTEGSLPLYQNAEYTVWPDGVVQPPFEARVYSNDEIRSEYEFAKRPGLAREIVFKFSINGYDNERPPFMDHRFILPLGGSAVQTPVIDFGHPHSSDQAVYPIEPDRLNPEEEVTVTFRMDASQVMESFRENGQWMGADGSVIRADEFQGFFIAGNTDPLTWDFSSLNQRADLQLTDQNGDDIYETALQFRYNADRLADKLNRGVWRLIEDVDRYPDLISQQPLVDALYQMSLEEMVQDIRSDSTFMAGREWPGVWTRDISYSILLSLALIEPETARRSLLAKVNDGEIIQDTGTGGSWPVSTDRMTWAMAAWEVYLATGDDEWLNEAYGIIKKSAEKDITTIFDPETGLVRGESSFLDWREQSYPAWMTPGDIAVSQNLGTNIVHYQTYRILSEMSQMLNQPHETWSDIADNISGAVNEYLWLEDAGYYGQFRYGRIFQSVSGRSETLGEALAILCSVADKNQAQEIISNIPRGPFGPACFSPQIPGIEPYHNNGIWPFVTAYYTWAAASAGRLDAVQYGLGSIYRAAALFLTNKENMAAESGDYVGTAINSDRQLWSVAGGLAAVYRVLFGMRLEKDGLQFSPAVPRAYDGVRILTDFPYRNALLNISVSGWGSEIRNFYLDGIPASPMIPTDLKGEHRIEIILQPNTVAEVKKSTVAPVVFSLPTPVIDSRGVFSPGIHSALAADVEVSPVSAEYHIYRNGQFLSVESNISELNDQLNSHAHSDNPNPVEFQVAAADSRLQDSFMSEPVLLWNEEPIIAEPVIDDAVSMVTCGSKNCIDSRLPDPAVVHYAAEIQKPGKYLVAVNYSNGNGPVNTDNKCALRTLYSDGEMAGVLIFPQQGVDNWDFLEKSNHIPVELPEGKHLFDLRYDAWNQNMNITENRVILGTMELYRISD